MKLLGISAYDQELIAAFQYTVFAAPVRRVNTFQVFGLTCIL